MEKTKYTSIIFTHFTDNAERSDTMRRSIESLIENTDSPYEITVVDNGGSVMDSLYLLNLAEQKKINTYIRNSDNMHFGFARNQGLLQARGDYICIVDNDILYKKGWLRACTTALDYFPGNIYTTPLYYPTTGLNKRYHIDFLKDDNGLEYELNMRAGSNCFVFRRTDLPALGYFQLHRIAGSRWTDNAVRRGFLACVVPGGLVEDIGLRKGYNFKETLPIKLRIVNGQDIILNEDEYGKK